MSNLEKLIQAAESLSGLEKQKLIQALQPKSVTDTSSLKVESIKKARGSLKGILPTIEEFLAEKHAIKTY